MGSHFEYEASKIPLTVQCNRPLQQLVQISHNLFTGRQALVNPNRQETEQSIVMILVFIYFHVVVSM